MSEEIENLDVEKNVRLACGLNNRLEMDFLENPHPQYGPVFYADEYSYWCSEQKKDEINEERRWQHSTEYLSVDLYFKKQYKQEKDLNEKDFALKEKKRIEGIIEQIKILGGEMFKNYNDCKTFQQSINYINFLNSIRNRHKNESKTIIDEAYLTLIFNRFEDNFNESKDEWIKRFVYPSLIKVKPIEIDKEAGEGSNRLVLIAILAAVQEKNKEKIKTFNYQDFVLDQFGIRDFDVAKSKHKKKTGYLKTFGDCTKILKK